MSDYGNRMLPIEPIEEPEPEMEQVVEPETQQIVEEPIFDKGEKQKKPKKKREMSEDAKQKLRERLAKAREKSLAVRRAKAEEKKKNKKPVGRPKKKKEEPIPTTKIILDDTTEVSFPTPEPEETTNNKVVMEIKEQQSPNNNPVNNHNTKIDYDKIVNTLYDKFKNEMKTPRAELQAKHKAQIPPASKPIDIPKPKQYIPSPRQRQQELEARIRADERMRIQQEQDAVFKKRSDEREARLRKATQNYYSKLPPTNFFEPTDWDNLFNPRK